MINYQWKIKSKNNKKSGKDWVLSILANNRGLTTKTKLEEFLNPNLKKILNVKLTNSKRAVDRVVKAVKNKEKIIVYSDYDADGICGNAIIWETLHDLGAEIMPYVPHRMKEGYGFSISAIKKLASEKVSLIITVDHGITAVDEVEFAKKLGIDVIITDHHVKPKILPSAHTIVHTTDLCGAGVGWRFCYDIVSRLDNSYKDKLIEKLELAAIATIADLVPLVGGNRSIVKLGLDQIKKTERPGLISLYLISNIKLKDIGTYEIGHVIAPRINAMGRLEHGLDSLRLLCSKSQKKADILAQTLSNTNVKRQELTTSSVVSALNMVSKNQLIGIVAHKDWHEGVIGLVASRLVEAHFRPMIVISQGKELSKGSARSIPGFNIVEAIRTSGEYLVDAGGHPMAAGFTIHTKHIDSFTKSINVYAQKNINQELLTPSVEIECELESEDINVETLKLIKTFEPYGVGNPQPVFATKRMIIEEARAVGKTNKHLKLQLSGISAIGFNMGEQRYKLRPGSKVDVAYTIDEDKFSGEGKVQIKIKDFKLES